MSYIPHTEAEVQQMLAQVGVASIDQLFDDVPAPHRFPKLQLPPAMSEMEIAAEMLAISEANDHAGDFAMFRGAGAYHHYIPSVVNHMLLRGEFYTGLHALSAGDFAGHAASDLRISEHDVRADGHGRRQRQPL